MIVQEKTQYIILENFNNILGIFVIRWIRQSNWNEFMTQVLCSSKLSTQTWYHD